MITDRAIEREATRVFRPYSSPPDDENYLFEDYLKVLPDNLVGPLRIFRSRMLDLGNLMCTDPAQRAVYRDYVFDAERELTALIGKWTKFYALDTKPVQEAIHAEHCRRPA